ncbi:MAG: DUF4296 domain-containing protein [Niabella sp.]
MKLFKNCILYGTVFLAVLLVACGSNKPKDILSEEKMKAVLWDVALAGEFANGYVYYQHPLQNRVAINNELLSEIYKIHDITKEEFDKSFAYYQQNPKKIMGMLDSIVAKQNMLESMPQANPNDTPPTAVPSPNETQHNIPNKRLEPNVPEQDIQ